MFFDEKKWLNVHYNKVFLLTLQLYFQNFTKHNGLDYKSFH